MTPPDLTAAFALLTRAGWQHLGAGMWRDPLAGYPVPFATALERAQRDAQRRAGGVR